MKKVCSNCGYAGRLGPDPCCDYILIEGKPRVHKVRGGSCKADLGCRAWKSKADVKKRSTLYDERKPLVPTVVSAAWAKYFKEQERKDLTDEWKADRRREREMAIKQLGLGSRGRREINQR